MHHVGHRVLKFSQLLLFLSTHKKYGVHCRDYHQRKYGGKRKPENDCHSKRIPEGRIVPSEVNLWIETG
jgi:hypothetical protein